MCHNLKHHKKIRSIMTYNWSWLNKHFSEEIRMPPYFKIFEAKGTCTIACVFLGFCQSNPYDITIKIPNLFSLIFHQRSNFPYLKHHPSNIAQHPCNGSFPHMKTDGPNRKRLFEEIHIFTTTPLS